MSLAGAERSVAMKRMASSNVLIVGMKGLGVEIGVFAFLTVSKQKLMSSSEKYRPRWREIGHDLRP